MSGAGHGMNKKDRDFLSELDKEQVDYETEYPVLLQLQEKFPLHSGLAYSIFKADLNRCLWTNYAVDVKNMKELILRDVTNERLGWNEAVGWDSFVPLCADFNGTECRQFVEKFNSFNENNVARNSALLHANRSIYPTDCITVGYLSSVSVYHAISHQMMDVPVSHNKELFKVNYYNSGNHDNQMEPAEEIVKDKIKSGCNKFFSFAKKLNAKEKAGVIKADRCQILVNLDGLMHGDSLPIMSYCPAPVSLTMFGYPGSSGWSSINYILVDERIVPTEFTDWMTEKLAYMPTTCYIGSHKSLFPNVMHNTRLVSDNKAGMIVLSSAVTIPIIVQTPSSFRLIKEMIRKHEQSCKVQGHAVYNGEFLDAATEKSIADKGQIIATSRYQYGLPEGPLIFATFNRAFKHDPLLLKAWEKILKAVPNSIMWFCCNTDVDIRKQILKFMDQGLKDRLFFSQSVESHEYLRRGLLVDLMLDPWVCNGHTTSLDALWAGVPVLTLQGHSFHTRVTSCLLYVLQLPVLTTLSQNAYVVRGIFLGRNPSALTILREEINMRKLVAPLYDVLQFDSDLESLYQRMWQSFMGDFLLDHILPSINDNKWMLVLQTIDLSLLNTRLNIAYVEFPSTTDFVQIEEDIKCFAEPGCSTRLVQTQSSKKGEGRMAPGVMRLERTPSPEVSDSETIIVPSRRKKLKQLHTAPSNEGDEEEPDIVDTPTSSQEAISPTLTSSFLDISPQLDGIEKFVTQGAIFTRHPVIFKAPDNVDLAHCGIQDKFYHGQRGVNLVAFETGVQCVLDSLLTRNNIEHSCMGAIMANQFIQLLEDGIPAMPPSTATCPDFFRSSRGLLFPSEQQLAWMYSLYDNESGKNMEPKLVSTNIFDMKWNGERRETEMTCKLCPALPVLPKMMANTLVASHYELFHSGRWYLEKKVSCKKCGKDISYMSPEGQKRHEKMHKPFPNCNELYFVDGEDEIVQPGFVVNLHESFENAADRYVRDAANAGLQHRKFYKAQRMATYTTWLAPACHLILKQWKKNPHLISGTSYIGYQFKALLQCHLRTTIPIIIPNLTSLPEQDRVDYSLEHFKFHGVELMYMMQRAFVDNNTMNELKWNDTNHEARGCSKPHCKICGNARKGAVKEFTGLLKKEHIFPEEMPNENVCEVCGFYHSNAVTRPIHANQHANLPMPMWNEKMTIKLANGASISSTHKINLI